MEQFQPAKLDDNTFAQIRDWETMLSQEKGTPIVLVAYEGTKVCPCQKEAQ
ncbi:hypothetical protein [Zongyangia hominis]|uniref:Uncharacterized protein n=1 Tax=Zongyangia hominis TaxID=2763677 RepID=A0A926ECC6_9FIRM|nr:hypothetical protein [Zongyangia hominis]MBC8569351.1 hypothetical protein [Zongyangia hominis]